MQTNGQSRPMPQAPRQALAAGKLGKDVPMIPHCHGQMQAYRLGQHWKRRRAHGIALTLLGGAA